MCRCGRVSAVPGWDTAPGRLQRERTVKVLRRPHLLRFRFLPTFRLLLIGCAAAPDRAASRIQTGLAPLRPLRVDRFDIAGVSKNNILAFLTFQAEIEAAMEGRGLRGTEENQYLARREALMTRAHKRGVDKEALRVGRVLSVSEWRGREREGGQQQVSKFGFHHV